MAANASARDERIEIRTTKEEKRLLTAAAAQERLDLTGFIMRSILPIARDAIDRSESIVVSDRDAQRVLDLLEPPPSRRQRSSMPCVGGLAGERRAELARGSHRPRA